MEFRRGLFRSIRPIWVRMVRQLAAVARLILAAVLIVSLSARPAAAQSILRDTETEAFFDDMARPLVVAAGLDPRSVRVVLVGDPSINAFVMQGQAVYLHSGLIHARSAEHTS